MRWTAVLLVAAALGGPGSPAFLGRRRVLLEERRILKRPSRQNLPVAGGCSVPQVPENGRVRIRFRGMKVQYFCNIGFERVGPRTSTCTGGRYSPDPPLCIAGGCPSPERPTAGHVHLTHHGAMARFTCRPGYELGLAQSPTVVCDGISWNASIPVCHASDVRHLPCLGHPLCGWNFESSPLDASPAGGIVRLRRGELLYSPVQPKANSPACLNLLIRDEGDVSAGVLLEPNRVPSHLDHFWKYHKGSEILLKIQIPPQKTFFQVVLSSDPEGVAVLLVDFELGECKEPSTTTTTTTPAPTTTSTTTTTTTTPATTTISTTNTPDTTLTSTPLSITTTSTEFHPPSTTPTPTEVPGRSETTSVEAPTHHPTLPWEEPPQDDASITGDPVNLTRWWDYRSGGRGVSSSFYIWAGLGVGGAVAFVAAAVLVVRWARRPRVSAFTAEECRYLPHEDSVVMAHRDSTDIIQ